MAQTTSELWKSLVAKPNVVKEYAFDIAGVRYSDEAEVEHDSESLLYSDFGIGNAAVGSLRVSLIAKNIPKGAQINRYVRLVSEGVASEWLPKGIFWINRRSEDDGYWTIEAFDAMRKAEQEWKPDTWLGFPMSMETAVRNLAAVIGVEVDPRTFDVLSGKYAVTYPSTDQTVRQTLGWIAAAHGGNFVISDEGKLLLVPLISAPAETNYLIDENNNNITFGGVRILV